MRSDAITRGTATVEKRIQWADLPSPLKVAIEKRTGPIIDGEVTIEQMGEAILEKVIAVASGQVRTKAEVLGQNDFIPWKRGVSL